MTDHDKHMVLLTLGDLMDVVMRLSDELDRVRDDLGALYTKVEDLNETA